MDWWAAKRLARRRVAFGRTAANAFALFLQALRGGARHVVELEPGDLRQPDRAVEDGRQQAGGQAAFAVPQDDHAEVAVGQQGHRAAIALHRAAVEVELVAGVVIDAPADPVAGRLQALAPPARAAQLGGRVDAGGMDRAQQLGRQDVGAVAHLRD